MADEADPFPSWHETATKGDLIRAVVYLSSSVTALAGVIVAMRTGDENEARDRMQSYFESSKELGKIINDLSGRDA